MNKKRNKTSKAYRKRLRNRRFNAVLYTFAFILVIIGVFIILNDTTYLFASCSFGGKRRLPDPDGSQQPVPTFPPVLTPAPAASAPATEGAEPPETATPPSDASSAPTLWPMPTPTPTPAPRTPGNHPRPKITYDPQPDDPVYVIFPQYAISGGRIKYYKNGAPEGKGIVCPVETVGLNSKGQMDTVRSALKAGWFYASGTPVKGGNTIIAGHNKYSGQLGYFSVIKDEFIKEGRENQVIVRMRNGEYAFYIVEKVEIWPYDQVPDYVMMTSGGDRLTLITCLGDYSGQLGTSRHRVIAICRPIG